MELVTAQTTASRQSRIQAAMDLAMQQVQGSAVVLDVASGELVAAYRLEAASRRLARPGSAIKPLTLAAMIDAGVVRPQTSVVCRRGVRLQGRTLDCGHVEVPEPLDGAMALAYSCNYFFAQTAGRLRPEALAAAFREAGLGSRTGLATDEAAGVIGIPAGAESLALMAVGEDSIQVTPLGLASAYRRLALRSRRDAGVKLVVEGLTAAVRFGTAQLARVEGLEVAGKTGTSPAADRLRTHAWFAGFAPASRPELVIVVFLEQGAGGSDAAPIAGRILAAYR
jgi:penicillin-binding protein 2